jgi:hypothetical protein
MDRDKELQQLCTIEQQCMVARNIKRMQGKLQHNTTTQVSINHKRGRRTVTSKDDIEDACVEENISRFSQSNNMPFMQEPLLPLISYLADTPAAKDILQGTFEIPPGMDKYTKLFINELRMPDNIRVKPMTQTEVTPEDNKQAWSKQKETISSEPKGLSFSHYKLGAQDPRINAFDARLRGIPYKYGFSPRHWQEITDVEILKKAGVYNIDKMRTITLMDAAFNMTLMDAAFNMNNKKLGRDLMIHAEDSQNLACEQYGSRKKHQSSTAAANKVLTMDLLRLRRQSGALCSNDAKSCYDRILHSVASALAARHQGAPRGSIESRLQTLQYAKHKIRTAYGVSTKHYGGCNTIPLQGLGQGNGALCRKGRPFVLFPEV